LPLLVGCRVHGKARIEKNDKAKTSDIRLHKFVGWKNINKRGVEKLQELKFISGEKVGCPEK
jgi:hypothetical protein